MFCPGHLRVLFRTIKILPTLSGSLKPFLILHPRLISPWSFHSIPYICYSSKAIHSLYKSLFVLKYYLRDMYWIPILQCSGHWRYSGGKDWSGPCSEKVYILMVIMLTNIRMLDIRHWYGLWQKIKDGKEMENDGWVALPYREEVLGSTRPVLGTEKVRTSEACSLFSTSWRNSPVRWQYLHSSVWKIH